jgi:sulfur carrier protein ThiS
MYTIKLQLYSWISSSLGVEEHGGNILKKKVPEGTTLRDLLTELANSNPEFCKLVFDPGTGKMNDEVVIMLNSRLVQFNNTADTKISDKDTITLSPVLVGG